ncbi:MAG: hypothetical protein ACQGVC_07145 [Myxococcota bacterium]
MRAARSCVLAACLGVGALFAAPAWAGPARIVILPVVVHSAAPDSGYVSRGLADMLSARLEQLGGLDVVRSEDPDSATSSLAEALTIGRHADGDYVLYGSFTQFGDGASLDVHCAPLDEGDTPPRSIFIQSGTMGEIIPKLDELADKVAHYVSGELPASAVSFAQRPEPANVGELRRRLEALERAVFPPLTGPDPVQEPAAEVEPASEGETAQAADAAEPASEPAPES